MTVKLHRCSTQWMKIGAHPCWRVQKALDAAGVDYVVVPGPVARSKRVDLERLSGQRMYPVIEFEDGSVYREESKAMVAAIREGRLMEAHTAPASAADGGTPTEARDTIVAEPAPTSDSAAETSQPPT